MKPKPARFVRRTAVIRPIKITGEGIPQTPEFSRGMAIGAAAARAGMALPAGYEPQSVTVLGRWRPRKCGIMGVLVIRRRRAASSPEGT
jgi:hypothetical protein